jgi:hypothetical protein
LIMGWWGAAVVMAVALIVPSLILVDRWREHRRSADPPGHEQ